MSSILTSDLSRSLSVTVGGIHVYRSLSIPIAKFFVTLIHSV